MRRISKILKSKPFLVFLVMILSVSLGIGLGYVTTKKSSASSASSSNQPTTTNELYTNLNDKSDGASTGPAPEPDPTSSSSTTNKQKTPKTQSPTNTQTTAPTCDKTQQPAYIAALNQYNSDMTAENNLHTTNQNDPTIDQSAEDTRHQAAVDNIQQTYDQAVAAVTCS